MRGYTSIITLKYALFIILIRLDATINSHDPMQNPDQTQILFYKLDQICLTWTKRDLDDGFNPDSHTYTNVCIVFIYVQNVSNYVCTYCS